ncbi:phage tail tape measure protein [Micromonospora sp. HUAS LYJ1]|uniref:phage tail tape measure protein n=1 Tax=Micromonospora sp. HUAS LYJ1 TaxID=3061626 RepID=UPI0026735C03|nr:phage tail tape measure protein [Micromonospora sp. HUAS LYJ1]WKU03758.1 phage tail protein [Micromonospora sp. HUAS LYJ1]
MALKLGELVAYLRADDTQLAKGLRAAQTKMRQAGEKAQQFAPVIGASLAAGIGAGLLGGMDLDAARAKLTAQVGDPVLAKTIGDAAGRVYARGFGESAGQAMEAARAVVSSHLAKVDDAGAIERMTAKVQAYATAWDTDVATATQYASTLIGSGLVKNADQAMDLITAASGRVPAALREDVLEAGNEYGQFFHALGFDGNQAFSLLVKASEKGTYGIDKAGDALKEFTIRSTDMSTASVAAYKSIGLDAEKMSNKILKGGKDAQGAFKQTVDGLLSIKDPTKQANAAIALFGTPLEDLNVQDIPEFLRSLSSTGAGLEGVAGASDRAGAALEKTASQKLEAFKRQAQQALVEKLAAAVPYIEATFGWLSRNSGWVVPLVTGLAGLASVIYAITIAMRVWAAVQVILNLALWTSPITWIVLGIVALVAVIVVIATKTRWFQDAWKWAWTGIKDGAVAVFSWVSENWPLLLAIITGPIGLAVYWIAKHWSEIKAGATSAKNWIVGKFNALVDFVFGLGVRMGRATRGMFDGLKSAFRSAVNWMIGRWNNFQLTLGGGSVLGVGIPSVTLSTPNIPYLAKGGTALAPGLSVVGERGPELAYLNRGATIQPLSSGPAVAGLMRLLLSGEFRIRGSDLVVVLREQVAQGGGSVQRVMGTA